MKHKRELKPFKAAGPYESVTVDILILLARSPSGNQEGVTQTSRYSKLPLAIPTRKFTSTNLATIFFEKRILSSGFSNYFLTDNGFKFVCNSF